MTMAAVGQNLTQAEREQAVRYLAETRANLADSVKGLSDAQYNFKPAPGRWPVAEIVEHLALVQGVLVQNVLGNIEKAPAHRPTGRRARSMR